MFAHGVMANVDVLSLHGFPGIWSDVQWPGWDHHIRGVQQVLVAHVSRVVIRISEVGKSTWDTPEAAQVDTFLEALNAPVPCVIWYDLIDKRAHTTTANEKNGFPKDPHEYNLGMVKEDGTEKVLFQLLKRVACRKVDERPVSGFLLRRGETTGPLVN